MRLPNMSLFRKTLPSTAKSANDKLKQPKELFGYSRTADGDIKFDDSSLSYYYFPESEVAKRYDLSQGVKSFTKFEEPVGNYAFHRAIVNHEKQTGTKIDSKIISFRGIFTNIMTAQESRTKFSVNVAFCDGQIFLGLDVPFSEQSKAEMNEKFGMLDEEQKKLFMYGGYKFETLATISKPWALATREEIESRYKKPVSDAAQYIAVVKTGFSGIPVVLGGEVDCAFDYKPDPQDPFNGKDNALSHYMELKTTKTISSDSQAITFEDKLFKTWAQSFLIGIPKVVYGFRDQNFLLTSVEDFETSEVPVLLKNSILTRPESRKQPNCMRSVKWLSAVVEFLVGCYNEVSPSLPEDLNAQANKIFKLEYHGGDAVFRELTAEESAATIEASGAVVDPELVEWRTQLRDKESSRAEQS